MNDLTQYRSVFKWLRPGDLIVFWGVAPISYAIEVLAGGPTHSAIVRQSGTDAEDVAIIECTINDGRNGVQTNPLGDVLANYGHGASAMALLLDDEHRKHLDLFQFYKFCGSSDGHTRYSIKSLWGFLARMVPVLGVRVAQKETPNALECAGFCTQLWEASGLLTGFNSAKMSPQDLVEMQIYRAAIPLLGAPKLKRFNTV